MLALREVRSHTLPAGFAPFGAHLLDSGGLVTWDRRDGTFLVVGPTWRDWRTLTGLVGSVADTVLAARIAGHDRLEVATRRAIVAFDFSGNRLGRTPLPDSLPIEAAQYGSDGWTVFARLATGYWAVARHRLGRWRLQAIPIRAAERGGAVPLIAELDGGRIVVLERRAPHQALVIERNGAARWMTGDAGLSGPSVPRTDPGPIIHVTGLFRLQSYLLRVTADLRSDWRQLALLDRDGRILRTRELEVPFGILTVSDDGSAALGLRGEPSRELVLYEISVPSPLVVTSTTRRMSDDLHVVADR